MLLLGRRDDLVEAFISVEVMHETPLSGSVVHLFARSQSQSLVEGTSSGSTVSFGTRGGVKLSFAV